MEEAYKANRTNTPGIRFAGASLGLMARTASAQWNPSGPINLMIAFQAGGATNRLAHR